MGVEDEINRCLACECNCCRKSRVKVCRAPDIVSPDAIDPTLDLSMRSYDSSEKFICDIRE